MKFPSYSAFNNKQTAQIPACFPWPVSMQKLPYRNTQTFLKAQPPN